MRYKLSPSPSLVLFYSAGRFSTLDPLLDNNSATFQQRAPRNSPWKRGDGKSLDAHSLPRLRDFYRVNFAYQLLFSSPCPGRFCSPRLSANISTSFYIALEEAVPAWPHPFAVPLYSNFPETQATPHATAISQRKSWSETSNWSQDYG